MIGDKICRWCGCLESEHDYQQLARECYPAMLDHKDALLWAAWMELNAIRARDGVPYNHLGYKSDVAEEYFSNIVDALSDALGDDAQPWPNKRWQDHDGQLMALNQTKSDQ